MKRTWLITRVIALALVLSAAAGCGPARTPEGHAGVASLAEPRYPKRVAYTEKTYDDWRAQKSSLSLGDEDEARFRGYLERAVPAFLSGRQGENVVCSPMDIYIGLAMLCETVDGQTRGQILGLLGQEDVESVRELTNRAWNALYVDDGVTKLELSDSLWLRDGMTFDKGVLDTLAKEYYACAFSGKMGGAEMNGAFQDWLNEHTGGLLKEEAGGVELSADTVLALASAIYFKDKWYFDPELTERDKFHAISGDVDVDYMHQTMKDAVYYWGDKYAAVSKSMENSWMMLILPDEGCTPEELLDDPQVVEALMGGSSPERRGRYDVVLTLPRFDVKSDGLLNDALMELGVTDIFDPYTADFSPLDARLENGEQAQLYLSRAIHGARVKVDEEGCEGAAYTVFDIMNGAAMPMETEEVEITFDRPFLFSVIKDGLPIFAGIVNMP